MSGLTIDFYIDFPHHKSMPLFKKKIFLAGVVCLFVLFITTIPLLFFKKLQLNKNIVAQQSVEFVVQNVSFTVYSSIPHFSIQEVDVQTLSEYIQLFGIENISSRFLQISGNNVQNINIEFIPITNENKNRLTYIINSEGIRPIYGGLPPRFDEDNKKVYISIPISQEYLETVRTYGRNKVDYDFSYFLLYSLYASTNNITTQSFQQTMNSNIPFFSENKPFIQVHYTSSFFKEILNSLSIVNKAYAVCTGDYVAAHTEIICDCPVGGEICYEQGARCYNPPGCIPGIDPYCQEGTCECAEECVIGDSGDRVECSIATTLKQCSFLDYSFSDCAGRGCSWTSYSDYCGNGYCGSGETCSNCEADCGPCVVCGDGVCSAAGGENCANCQSDCGACPPPSDVCGDGICSGTESCAGCPLDCGVCPGGCGDGVCGGWEDCGNCSQDCGACPPPPGSCGDGSCDTGAGETCGNCSQDCGACPPPPCSPVCNTPYCGQGNGCGGSCPSTHAFTPVINSLQPIGLVYTNASEQVTLTWWGQASYYQVELEGTGGTGTNHIISDTTTSASYTFTAEKPNYVASVRAVRSTCGTATSDWETNSLNVFLGITGTVYFDENADAVVSGDYCTGPTGTTQQTGNVQATYTGGDIQSPVEADGTFTLGVPVGTSNTDITLTPDSGWVCSCPQSCEYGAVVPPESGIPFFVSPGVMEAWWQVIGGNVYAASETGTALMTRIPTYYCDSDTTSCLPYLSLQDELDTTGSSGTIVTGGGSADVDYRSGLQIDGVDEEGRNYVATGSLAQGMLENYSYFYRLYSMGLNPVDDFGESASVAQKPSGTPANERAYYAGGDMTIQDPWSVAAGESYVIFVQGNLHVQDTIEVEQGGFVAFIVQGDILFDPSVGQPVEYPTHADGSSSTEAVVEGIFISDGTIHVETRGEVAGGDDKFVAEGMFIGWGGVSLERSFKDGADRGELNNTNPAELFRYRPDFLISTPERMKKPLYEWQEVAP